MLDALSVKSKNGFNLRKTLRHFDKESLIREALDAVDYYDGLSEELGRVTADYRIKSGQSIRMKYEKHYPGREAEKVFNDLIGFRSL